MNDLPQGLPVPDKELQTELERNVLLLKHLSNMYQCFGLRKHSATIERTVRKVERRIQNIRTASEQRNLNDVCCEQLHRPFE